MGTDLRYKQIVEIRGHKDTFFSLFFNKKQGGQHAFLPAATHVLCDIYHPNKRKNSIHQHNHWPLGCAWSSWFSNAHRTSLPSGGVTGGSKPLIGRAMASRSPAISFRLIPSWTPARTTLQPRITKVFEADGRNGAGVGSSSAKTNHPSPFRAWVRGATRLCVSAH